MRIGLDVMGGDKAPQATIAGAVLALKEFDKADVLVLFGNENTIKTELSKFEYDSAKIEIIHCDEEIAMDDHPTKAFSDKPNASMVVGFKHLGTKAIDAFSSAGNTGAMLVGSIYSVNNIPGIIRPATAAVFPKENGGHTIILDVGTNPGPKPDVLYQYAILGSIYAESIFDIKDAKVGLLNIGEEEKKGNPTTQATYQLMKETEEFNFIGNIEGRDLLNDKADVVVCDGFTGNVVLKQMESVYEMLVGRGLTDDYIERFNYENHGGTPILGINASVVLGHGISNEKAIKNMVLHSRQVAKEELAVKIKNAVLKNSDSQN
jgi:glycerol-3-phosphate acyltransferase PlsX